MPKRTQNGQDLPYTTFLDEIVGATPGQIEKTQAPEATFDLLAVLDSDIEAATDSSKGIGTKATGYTKPEYGPFLCINCVHSSREGDRCNHPEVMADPDVEQDGDMAVIEPAACCNEFRPRKMPK